MRARGPRSSNWFLLVPVLLWLLLYLLRLPHTVQGGDSGEFVTASMLLTVPHPPGYPLFVWFLKIGRLFLPLGSPYWQAAFLNSLLSLGSLSLLMNLRKDYSIALFLAMLLMGGSATFWKYSLIPDVFALHWLLVIGLCFAFLTDRIRDEASRLWIMSGLFALGFANHVSICFLAPLWIYQAVKTNKILMSLGNLLAGAGLTSLFYLTFFLFNRAHPLSWGYLENLHDIFRHFLRVDYGTFRLSSSTNGTFFRYYLQLFMEQYLIPFSVLWILAAVMGILGRLKKIKFEKTKSDLAIRNGMLLLSFVLYVGIFFSFSNVGPWGFGREVFERFLGMPIILLSVVLAMTCSDRNLQSAFEKLFKRTNLNIRGLDGKKTLTVLGVLSLVLSWYDHGQRLDYSRRVILEEWAKNFVAQMPPKPEKPTFVSAMSDSGMFALYYVLGVLQVRPDFHLLNPIGFHIPWVRKQLIHNFPDLKYPEIKPGDNITNRTLFDFIRDNHQNYNFLADENVDIAGMKSTYVAVGRFVAPGSGVVFMSPSSFKLQRSGDWSQPGVSDYRVYDPDLDVYAKYAHYYLAKGMALYKSNRGDEASMAFDAGLQEVLYCIPCVANRCQLLESSRPEKFEGCQAILKKMQSDFYNYFGRPR